MAAAVAHHLPATELEEVLVDLGPRSYPILVGSDLLSAVGPRLASLGFRGRCGLVTSPRVAGLHGESVLRSLREAELQPVAVEVPDGEEHKNLAWLAVIYDRLLDGGLDRRSAVVALGGGVVGDLAGFAAATLLRGLAVVQVPTTLLAQVDAAVGGKTAVNHALGKNLIGTFHQPRFVVADVDVLRTLPRREFVAGLAEVIKTGAIVDAALFRQVEQQLSQVLAQQRDVLVSIIAGCARHKASIVAADEREERSGRIVLNFGHTIGHAVEVLTEYREFLHGEAVAIGMVAAARVSQALGCCDGRVVSTLEQLLARVGLPTELPADVGPDALAIAMQTDKKGAAGRIRFVALEDIGRTRIVELTPAEIVNRL